MRREVAENHNDHIEYYRKVRKRIRKNKKQDYRLRNS